MIRTIQLGPEMLGTISRHAERDQPLECCGMLIGSICKDCINVERVVEAGNISDGDRQRSYQIDWQSLFREVKSGRGSSRQIVGFYHSHPDGSVTPSASDLEFSWRAYVYLIVPIMAGEVGAPSAWFLPESESRFVPLEISIVD